jgi:hypothetical protein
MTGNKRAKAAVRKAAAEAGVSYTAARRLDPLIKVSSNGERVEVNPQINWDHLTQPLFDEIVEALLDRIYDVPGTEVHAINGRGGDGGRDVVVRQGDRLRIFQLKFFRDGFPSQNRTRRRQIAKSFQTATQHDPYGWVLVIPGNPTPGERQFVEGLGTAYPQVKIRIMGRKELDSHLAAQPDLVAYFTRDQAREAAIIFGQEQAVLEGGLPDLTDRLQRLARVADTLDPNWGVDIEVTGETVRHTLRAKHRYAAVRSPIELTVQGTFGPEHGALAQAIRRSLGFGAAEPFTLPPEVVEALTVTGPAWLAGSEGGVEVTWTPARRLPETPSAAQLRMIDDADHTMSSHQAKVLHAGSGPLGYSLEMDFYGLATVTLLFGSGHKSEMTGQFTFTQALPVLVQQAVRLFGDLHTCAAVEVELDGEVVGRLTCVPNRLDEQTAKELAVTEMTADDLAIVQNHCRAFFLVPHDLSLDDRIALRVAHLLVEGHCVIHPRANVYTATLNGRFDEAMRGMFAVDGPVSITVEADLTIEVAGHRLAIGRAMLFHTQVEIRDKTELLAALKAGRAAGRQMRLAPLNGQSFRVFLPAAQVGREDEPLQVTGWGLPALDGPPRG